MPTPEARAKRLSGLDAVIQEQTRVATVIAGLQRDVGYQTTDVAKIQRDLEELHRLIRGVNGDRSLIVRMASVEQAQTFIQQNQEGMRDSMKEHREAVEGQLATILTRMEERGRDDRSRALQVTLAIVAGALSILTCLISAIVAILHH